MRKDAKRCKDVSDMNQILIDLKPKRSLGELYINESMDVTNLKSYLDKHKSDENKITYFHSFATCIGKTLYHRNLLNRFIANRHVYEHNDITLSFVMKVNFNDKSEEIMVILPINKDDNIFSISNKIRKKVSNVRNSKDKGKGANNGIKILAKLPNIVRIPLVGIFKLCDKFGFLPSSLVKDNIYYSSMIVSDVGTFKCGGIYHNVTDFGTCSGLITMGEVKEKLINNEKRYFCEFGITFDERVADGYYFIKSIKFMKHLLNNPELLEDRISEKVKIEEER